MAVIDTVSKRHDDTSLANTAPFRAPGRVPVPFHVHAHSHGVCGSLP